MLDDDKIVIVNNIPDEDLRYIYKAMDFIKEIDNNLNKGWEQCKLLVQKEIFTFIGSGCNGYVMRYKNYAIKFYFGGNDYPGKDGEVLHELQDCIYFPKLFYYYKNTYMVTEFIEGVPLKFENLSRVNLNFANNFEKALNFAVSKGIYPMDICHFSDNTLIKDTETPVLVDLGCFRIRKVSCEDFSFGFLSILREHISQVLPNTNIETLV